RSDFLGDDIADIAADYGVPEFGRFQDRKSRLQWHRFPLIYWSSQQTSTVANPRLSVKLPRHQDRSGAGFREPVFRIAAGLLRYGVQARGYCLERCNRFCGIAFFIRLKSEIRLQPKHGLKVSRFKTPSLVVT